MQYYQLFIGVAALGLAVVAYLFRCILKISVTNEKAEKIAAAIRQGAMTFLREEYKIISIVVLIGALILAFIGKSPIAAITFVVGAIFSMATGFIGMRAATAANVRATLAAK